MLSHVGKYYHWCFHLVCCITKFLNVSHRGSVVCGLLFIHLPKLCYFWGFCRAWFIIWFTGSKSWKDQEIICFNISSQAGVYYTIKAGGGGRCILLLLLHELGTCKGTCTGCWVHETHPVSNSISTIYYLYDFCWFFTFLSFSLLTI